MNVGNNLLLYINMYIYMLQLPIEYKEHFGEAHASLIP